MAADLERIEAELAARVDEFRAGGDPARILADETLALLIALARAAGERGRTPTSAAVTFAWGWWCRHLAASADTGADTADNPDLQQAREAFYVVELLDVTQVPSELRHPVPTDPREDPGELLNRAQRLIATGSWAEAAGFAYAAIHATPQNLTARAVVLTQAGAILHRAFLYSADPSYLDRAAAAFLMAADDSDPGDPLIAERFTFIATVAEQQYQLRRTPADLERAIGCWRMAVTQYPAESEERAAAASKLSAVLLAGYRLSRDADLLLEATEYARQAVRSAMSGPERIRRHWRLGEALIAAHTVTHALADVDDAIAAFRETAGDLAFPLPDDLCHCLFILYRIRFGWYGRSRDLDTAIWWGEYAVQLAAPDARWRDDDAQALSLLHGLDQLHGPGIPGHCREVKDDWLVYPLRERLLAFIRHDDRTGLLAADAVPLAVRAIKRYRLDTGPTKARQLCTIGWFFWCRYLVLPRGRGADDFRLAVDYFARLAQVDPQLVPAPVARLVEMGEVDLDPGHYRTFSHMAAELRRPDSDIDVDAIVSLLRRLLPLSDGENQDRCRAILVWALAVRAGRRGSVEDLDEAAAMLGSLHVDAPAAAPERALYLSALAARLESRFHQSRTVADLDRTITAREATLTGEADPAERAGMLPGLSSAYWVRYENFGRLTDLEQAVRWAREAAADPQVSSPKDQATALSDLSIALGKRFLRVGERADIDEAVEVARTAVRLTDSVMAPREAQALKARHNLRALLFTRYQDSRRLADLDEAITIGRVLVAQAAIGSARLPEFLTALSLTLSVRHAHLGGEGYLEEAIAAGRQAVESFPAGHPGRPWALSNLALVLRDLSIEEHGLDEAIALFQEAIATAPANHPTRTNVMVYLATALLHRSFRDKSLVDLDLGIKVSRAAVSMSAAPADERIRAASMWATSAMTRHLWRTATEAYEAAVDLLPLIAWRGGSRRTKERQLAEWESVARDGAAAAVQANRPNQALRLLEAGRAVLWNQLLETRSDLTALREVAPELAARCEAVRAELDQAGHIAGVEELRFE